MRLRIVTLPLLVLLLGVVPAGAHDPAPRHAQRDLRQLAARITGGASILVDVSSSSSEAVEFHKEANHFEQSLDRNRDHVREDWRSVRDAFGPASRTAKRGRHRDHDSRIGFLVSHLEEDLAAGDRLVELHVAAHGDVPVPDRHDPGPGMLSLIDEEACVGTNRGTNSCNSPRDTLRFSIPRDVAEITRLDVEWRDLGGHGSGEIYLNDRLLWRTDVNRNWDTDDKSFDVRVPLDSTLSVRSSNGDPIWIRRLSAETVREAGRNREDGILENLFGLLWPERGRDPDSD